MSDIKIKRALIAVYDKTGIADFARALVDEFGIEIISTGGTAKHLKQAGIPVTMVEEVTGFPEMLDGRIKTLHPKIHAAILADRDNPEHMRQLEQHGIKPIDMVVVNLYPFEKTVADPNCTFDQAIEMIDIGGPCMLRAAAKHSKHVVVVPVQDCADMALKELREKDCISAQTRRLFAQITFTVTTGYDSKIAQYLGGREGSFPANLLTLYNLIADTRYGENPSQKAAVYYSSAQSPSECSLLLLRHIEDGGYGRKLLSGAEMSFNNYVDGDSALSLVKELSRAQGLWHRFSTGADARGHADDRLELPRATRRNLPHIQNPGATYFVTFRLSSGALSPEERDVVLEACRFWHGKKATFHAIVVMPDHVHLLLTPHKIEPGRWVALGEITHSIKRHSALQINRSRGATGALWQDEAFDRIMRHEKEFWEKCEYMRTNPGRAGLAGPDQSYKWFWDSGTRMGEMVQGAEKHRLETGATKEPHRLETGATKESHRLETGATRGYAVAFVKHTNACGCAIGDDPIDTYRRAYLGDPIAAAGGVLCMNFPVTREIADTVMNSFGRWGKAAGAAFFKLDVWIAPSFDDDAVQLITTPTEKRKWGKECRLLAVGPMDALPDPNELDYKKIIGGMLVQTRDLLGLNEDQWKVVTRRAPSESEISDLRFAWLVCKHTKSNAISICRDGQLLGNGAGQMSRVKSCDLAIQLARESGHADQLQGAVAAGDAFFPVPDGPQKLIDAGITAIIHPGGSNRDAETVAVADAANVAMIITGTRHFKH